MTNKITLPKTGRQLGRRRMPQVALSLDRLIDDLLFEYNLKAVDARVVMQLALPNLLALLAIWGNPIRPRRLLRSLIENVIRHASRNSVAEIATPKPGIITVRNHGKPQPENPKKMFELWHYRGGKR